MKPCYSSHEIFSMQSLDAVYQRWTENKKKLRDVRRSAKDALHADARYQTILDETVALRARKKSLESEILDAQGGRAEEEGLALEVKTDAELLTDLTLTKFLAGESVEIVDEENGRLVPAFSVRFTKP